MPATRVSGYFHRRPRRRQRRLGLKRGPSFIPSTTYRLRVSRMSVAPPMSGPGICPTSWPTASPTWRVCRGDPGNPFELSRAHVSAVPEARDPRGSGDSWPLRVPDRQVTRGRAGCRSRLCTAPASSRAVGSNDRGVHLSGLESPISATRPPGLDEDGRSGCPKRYVRCVIRQTGYLGSTQGYLALEGPRRGVGYRAQRRTDRARRSPRISGGDWRGR